MRAMTEDEEREAFMKTLRAVPGYPWLPCPICKRDGFPNAVGGCDHTASERARAANPGLVLDEPADFINPH